jgi:hypothetical protein
MTVSSRFGADKAIYAPNGITVSVRRSGSPFFAHKKPASSTTATHGHEGIGLLGSTQQVDVAP